MRRLLGWMIVMSVAFASHAFAFQDPAEEKAIVQIVDRLNLLEEINVTAYKPPKAESTDLDEDVKTLLEEAEEAESE